MTPAAIEAAARALHRFNAPRVANDVEPWESVPPNTQTRWRKQAELALLAAGYDALVAAHDRLDSSLASELGVATTPWGGPGVAPTSHDPFARLSRPNIEHDDDVTNVEPTT